MQRVCGGRAHKCYATPTFQAWDSWLPMQVQERSELGEFASLEHAAEAEAGARARAQVAELLAADAMRAEQLSAAQAGLAAARAALEDRDLQAHAPTLSLCATLPTLHDGPPSLQPWHAMSTPSLNGGLSWLPRSPR